VSERHDDLPIDPLWGKLYPLGLKKGDRRKAEIVEAVVLQTAENGIESLSFETIGQRTQMTKSQVLYHVGSRDDMICKSFEYILYHAQQNVVEQLTRSKPGLERLLAYIRGHFEWVLQKPEQLKFYIQALGYATHHLPMREIGDKARDGGRERIQGILQDSDLKIGPQKIKLWAQLFHDQLTGNLIHLISSNGISSSRVIEADRDALMLSIRYAWRTMTDRRQSDSR